MALLGPEIGIILITSAATVATAALITWFIRNREFEPEDVTIGFLGPSLAAIYLLVLALSLATEWQAIGSAQQAVGNEAVAIRQLYWATSGLPSAAAAHLRAQVRDYTVTVVNHDWPQMQQGTLDDQSQQMLTAISTYVLQLSPGTSSADNAQQYALAQVSVLASARAQREAAAESRLPIGLLAAVIVTSGVVCLFPFAGGIRTSATSIAMAILQATLVTIGVVVVFQLNNPFTGPLATSPAPLTAVASQIGVR
jgi:hypothetical protein